MTEPILPPLKPIRIKNRISMVYSKKGKFRVGVMTPRLLLFFLS